MAPHNTPEAVKQYYEEWTDRYLEGFGTFFQAQQAARPSDLVRNLVRVAGIRKGMRVLDAGCGVCGPAIALIKQVNVDVEALTLADAQVNHARDLIAKARWKRGRVHVRQGDFHRLPEVYGTAQFDVVYFLESLVHSHDPATVLAGVRQVLKPGGALYIKDLFRGPEHPENPAVTDFPVRATSEQFCLQVQRLGDILNLLTANGFRIERCGVPAFKEDFSRGNAFTARHLVQLRADRTGPWVDEGLIFLHWLEVCARRHY